MTGLCHLATFLYHKGDQVTKPIMVVKMTFIQVKGFLIKGFTFLGLLDIKALGLLSLVTMLLLIGLALFTARIGFHCFLYLYIIYRYHNIINKF